MGPKQRLLTSSPQAPFGLPQDSLFSGIGGIHLGGWGVNAPAIYDQWTYDYKDVATIAKPEML
jgi:hypothetical protein